MIRLVKKHSGIKVTFHRDKVEIRCGSWRQAEGVEADDSQFHAEVSVIELHILSQMKPIYKSPTFTHQDSQFKQKISNFKPRFSITQFVFTLGTSLAKSPQDHWPLHIFTNHWFRPFHKWALSLNYDSWFTHIISNFMDMFYITSLTTILVSLGQFFCQIFSTNMTS